MQLRPLTLVGIVISMVTGIGLGITIYGSWLQEAPASGHSAAFDRVLDQVHANYVDEVDKDELVVSALRGMLGELDAHSLFLDTGDYHELQTDTTGRFGGIGIELGLDDGYFTVIAPMDDTPAARAGLAAGDRLVAIDGQSLEGERLIDVVGRLRGEPGSEVTLRLQNDAGLRNVTVTRATIELASVRARLLEPGYAYVRISQFQMGTGPAFESAVEELREASGSPIEGLVLDLRDNPGGVLQASVDVADALLDKGLIVYTKGRLPSSKHTYRASPGDVLDGAPVVLLMNRGSASAAEVVAGALQDHGRATVMGTRSYGKGSVQSVMPIAGDQAIKLTTAYYYTPNGRSIHDAGIEPDLEHSHADEDPGRDHETQLVSEALQLLKGTAADRLHARL